MTVTILTNQQSVTIPARHILSHHIEILAYPAHFLHLSNLVVQIVRYPLALPTLLASLFLVLSLIAGLLATKYNIKIISSTAI